MEPGSRADGLNWSTRDRILPPRAKPSGERPWTHENLPEVSRSLPGDSACLAREAQNRKIVRKAFERWGNGEGSFTDILDERVMWTITGSGPSARSFSGRQVFIDEALGPISARFASGMKPTIKTLMASGDEVVVHWDGVARMKDGQTYRNSYAWFFRMRKGKVVESTAFLDLATYDCALEGAPLPPWGAPLPDRTDLNRLQS